uniref:Eukaryotic translation initiation factor 5B n=1 Tax=Arcella intermedia TaxID=1963864 RepID=A0A6B2KXC4_9EUKA
MTGAAALAAKALKKRQDNEERLRKEEEVRIRLEKEEEERSKREEEERQKEKKRLQEENKKRREEQAEQRKKIEAQKKREQVILKYGLDPKMVRGLNPDTSGGGITARGGRARKAQESKEQKSESQPIEPENTFAEPVELKKEEVQPVSQPEPEVDWEEKAGVGTKSEEGELDWEEQADAMNNPAPAKEPEKKKVMEVQQCTTAVQPEPKIVKQEVAKKQKEKPEKQSKEITPNKTKLRSAICCVLGHVDTGKTKLLDKMRSSDVQGGEAGGITQQIGATFFPLQNIKEMTSKIEENLKKQFAYKLPGLLVIDTPGHESFMNLRSRGSSLCDIAILVVDIMHGVEPQTRESLNLLRKRKTPFVVALNKVDRCYGWKAKAGSPISISLQNQEASTKLEFEDRVKATIADLAAEGLNAELYYKNKDLRKVISLVPTSALSGEGIPDLLLLLVQLSQNLMADKLLELSSLNCTVLEVKKTTGHGTTLDVILANGVLNQGDRIMICSLSGEPIITTIKSILMPPAATELRVKSEYTCVKTARAAIGCKIDAPGIDNAVAGSPLFVINPGDDLEAYKKQVSSSLNYLNGKIEKSGVGVYVQTSTLGSMEALLEYLKEDCKIPVCGIRIGPVHKIDVMKASAMVERKKEYAVILAFDVEVTEEARVLAHKSGVRIFEAEIIYHLFDQFKEYTEQLKADEIAEVNKNVIVFPCILRIIGKEMVFNKRNPIVCGVHVEGGILKLNTPIVVMPKPEKDEPQQKLELGIVRKIEREKGVEIKEAKVGDEVSVEITVTDEKKQKYMYGRHFNETDLLYSQITREAIDALKTYYTELVLQRDVYDCIVQLKLVLGIN